MKKEVNLNTCKDKVMYYLNLALLISTLATTTFFLTGCKNDSEVNEEITETNENEEIDMNFNQFDLPKEGETIAIMHTNKGDIKIRLFPKYAPKAVENFVGLAKAGKYDGVIFHRVINDFMIQSGDYTNGNGTGGQSIWGREFADELNENVLLYRGALAMANRGSNTNGSQFFIVQTKTIDPMLIKQLEGAGIPQEYIDGYKQHGGTPHLDFRFTYSAHTVFGQVYEGLDIVDTIAQVTTDQNDKPLEDVIITSIDIETATNVEVLDETNEELKIEDDNSNKE